MKCIDAKYHSLIRQAINQQLRFEPLSETRNRKPLLEPTSLEADWELRFGPNNRFRVFYAVDQEAHDVRVVAVGVNDRDRLYVGGEEMRL